MQINKLKNKKWNFFYFFLVLMVLALVYVAIDYAEKSWLPNALQTIAIIIGLLSTFLIFFKSNEDSEKKNTENLKNLQKFNSDHIKALQIATEKQIETLRELNVFHINALKESTSSQIRAVQELTEKQINALHNTTNIQISAFENEISEVVTKLSDNSIILGEILGRELEKSLEYYNRLLASEKRLYKEAYGFKVFRTDEERNREISLRSKRIKGFQSLILVLNEKYKLVKEFLEGEIED